MTSARDELLGMFSDAGVSHEIVTVGQKIVVVTMPDVPDGWFEISPATPSPGGEDRGFQWHVHRYLPDGLSWAVVHSSAGTVDQVRSALLGRPTPLPDAPARAGVLAGWHRATGSTGAGIGELHRITAAGHGVVDPFTVCGLRLSGARLAGTGDPGPVCRDCQDDG